MGPKYKLIYPSYDEMHDASVELARKLKKNMVNFKEFSNNNCLNRKNHPWC